MSAMTGKSVVLLLCLVAFSAQRSTPADNSYVAAVVEYQVQPNTTTNLANYVERIQEAAEQNADIIVFPEMTLTVGHSVAIPINSLIKEYPIPALQPQLYDEILVSLSKAARANEIYVVVNVQEVVDCTVGVVDGETCPRQKVYLFNTNVVFDRNGTVIDRYRKINLFGESTRTPALTPDLGIFTTDFGVTFGHFICFDLMFQVPAIQIVQKHSITDIIFSTMWFSELPYLTAVQIQQAYAYSMNVNFIGAGANNVRVGSAGSGIFSGQAGALVSIMPGVPTTKLLVAEVPKVPGRVQGGTQGPIYDKPSDQDGLQLITDPSLASHTTRLLTSGTEDFRLIDSDVVCRFRVQMTEGNGENSYRYRAGAFSGVRSYSGVRTGGVRSCAIFACTNSSIESCGKRFPLYSANATAIFNTLEITAAVPNPVTDNELSAKNAVYFPITLDTAIMPLKPADYNFVETQLLNAINVYTFTLRNFKAELYSFAVWGREYTTDGEQATGDDDDDDNNSTTTTTPAPVVPDSSNVHQLHFLMLSFCIIALLKL